MNEIYIFLSILIVSIATYFTRVLPFTLFSNKKPSPLFKLVEVNLPVMIMIILVFYAIKDVSFFTYPFAIPEFSGILLAFLLHVFLKQALLSILVSTIFYMFLIQNIV